VQSTDQLEHQRRLQQEEDGDGDNETIGADPVERQQEQSHQRQHLQHVAAIAQAMEQADRAQHGQAPYEAPREIDAAPRRAVHDDEKADAETQRQQRERLVGECLEYGVVPELLDRVGGWMRPVELV
jgi:hypothetical protein